MSEKKRVVVVEDDPFARDFILNILTRDWRTRVVGEFDSFNAAEFKEFLENPINGVDLVVLDTEVPWKPDWPLEAFEIINRLPRPPKLIFLCTIPIPRYWNDVLFNYESYQGYLVKQEILYSLATAVSLANKGTLVTTESVLTLPISTHSQGNIAVLDGTKNVYQFTEREKEILRLGLLLNQSQRDLEDEMVISRDWISELMGSIYNKLCVQEVLAGEIAAETLFSDKAVLDHINSILSTQKSGTNNLRKTPWLGTLAFHLLTIPDIQRLK